MSVTAAFQVRPTFIQTDRGRLFGLFVDAGPAAREALVYLPPFAEEMNRCRALAAEQARALAGMGVSSLLLDPWGTGDSDGDLEECRWEMWLDDVRHGARWLAEQSGLRPGLWGCRLGGLLAAQACESAPDDFARLLLWQPVLNGKQFLTQYLRLRVAWLMERDLPAETTDGIRAEMAAGHIVEVAGYPIAGALAEGLDGARFPAGETALAGPRIDWFEHGADAEAQLSIAANRAIGQLQSWGAQVHAQVFTGAPLWQLHKRDDLPDLIARTTRLFGEPS